jgi:hypothetical protein
MIDLSKLTPAPWVAEIDNDNRDAEVALVYGPYPKGDPCLVVAGVFEDLTDGEFIALARNAFDVMMRRGWFPKRADISRKWFVLRLSDSFQHAHRWCADDPFTALVEADEWYKENVEGRPCKSEEPPLTLERRAQLILNWHQARMPAHDFKAMVLRHLKEIDDAWAKTLKDFARSQGTTITFEKKQCSPPANTTS